jgi:hypothetical protein
MLVNNFLSFECLLNGGHFATVTGRLAPVASMPRANEFPRRDICIATFVQTHEVR